MSLRELYELLATKLIQTSVCHLQPDGLVEWFNQMLKNMISKFIHDDELNWHKLD